MMNRFLFSSSRPSAPSMPWMSLLFLSVKYILTSTYHLYFLFHVSIQSLIVVNISHHQITSFHLMLLPISLFLFVTNLPKICGFHIFPPHTARLLKSVLLFTHYSDLLFTKMKENIFIHNFLSPSAFDTAHLTLLFLWWALVLPCITVQSCVIEPIPVIIISCF